MRQAVPLELVQQDSLFARALETERLYFELGARIERLTGADLAWMPGLTASPAAAVIQRVEPDVIAAAGAPWVAEAEAAMAATGASLVRIYLDAPGSEADALLERAGYTSREELLFAHSLPAPQSGMAFRRVESNEDWRRKLRLHEAVQVSPDGHSTSAVDLVELERRKCAEGMDCFLAELDGQAVGAVGAVWGERMLRLKNIVVHPAHRRRSIAMNMLRHLAATGRERGIGEQCVVAVRGEAGEFLYRSAGMRLVGAQVEWSKVIGRTQ